DRLGDIGDHAGSVFGDQSHRDWISRRVIAVGFHPFDLDDALGVNGQAGRIRASGRVHRHTLTPGNVTHDLLSADRITAAGAIDHYVIDAFDCDAIGKAQRALDHLRKSWFLLLLEFTRPFGREELCNDVSRQGLAVADCRQEVIGAGASVIWGYPFKLPA